MSNKWWVKYKWVINYESETKIISVTYPQWIMPISKKFLLNTIFHFQNAVQRFMHASVEVPTQCIIIRSIFGVFALFSIMCGFSGFFTVIFRLFMIIRGYFTKFVTFYDDVIESENHQKWILWSILSYLDILEAVLPEIWFLTIFVTCYDDVINTGNGVHDDKRPRFSILTKFHNCPFTISVSVQTVQIVKIVKIWFSQSDVSFQ